MLLQFVEAPGEHILDGLLPLPVEDVVDDLPVRPVDAGDVEVDVDVGDGLPDAVTGGRDDRLFRYLELRRYRHPGMAGPVHRNPREAQLRGHVLQDVVYPGGPVAGLRVGVQGVEEVSLPGHPLEDRLAFRLHLDGVGLVGLRPPELQAAVHDVGGVEEVLGVHPYQEEAGEEEVDVLALPVRELGVVQAPQVLRRGRGSAA